MSVILVFVLVVIGVAGWWLTTQRIFSRPWLEVGADTPAGMNRTGLPTEKLALTVFLAVVGCVFALFASAYFMRAEYVDWRPMPVPRLVWINTVLLVLASVALQCAVVAERRGDTEAVRIGLAAGTVATLGFLLGQLAAWRELTASGYLVTGNPANSFFYLLTGVHGLHILGGLVALARCAGPAWRGVPARRGAIGLELCATYWHFLLFVWLGIVLLLLGWVNAFLDICRQLLT
jgi:cytochrome c oxidase subunit III